MIMSRMGWRLSLYNKNQSQFCGLSRNTKLVGCIVKYFGKENLSSALMFDICQRELP